MYLYSFWKCVPKSQEQEHDSKIFHLKWTMGISQYLNTGETSYFGSTGYLFMFYIIRQSIPDEVITFL